MSEVWLSVEYNKLRRFLFDILKGIIDEEWGPYEDDHYWELVDEHMDALIKPIEVR